MLLNQDQDLLADLSMQFALVYRVPYYVQVSVSAGMITDKITLHINRKVGSSKDSSIEWKAEAEER